MSEASRSMKARVAAWMCIIFEVVMTYPLARHYVRDVPSVSWPTVEGIIVRSEAGATKGRSGCEHILRYTYNVRGTEYTGSRKTLYDVSYSPEDVKTAASKFPVEMSVTVHYNPSSPRSSVLQPGLDEEQWMLHWIGLVMVVVAPIIAVSCFYYAAKCDLQP